MRLFHRRRCDHPLRCRDTIWNGAYWVSMCALCGEIFDMVPGP